MNERFARHIRLTGFGNEAQNKLSKASVLIIGCGGLGCPAALYLTRGGIGRLGLMDADLVSLSNLHRQVLFNEEDIGKPKVDVAKKMLVKANSAIEIDVFNSRLNTTNWKKILGDYDVVLDCSDNFTTRYLVNDGCVLLDKPLVYGAANQFEGQVSVFNHQSSANLRDLFPQIPNEGVIQNCEEAGVLGVVTGIIGEFMALETIKIITGVGKPLTNQMLIFDGLNSETHRIRFTKNPNTIIPETQNVESEFNRTSWKDFATSFSDFELVDVRTVEERSESHQGGVHIPLDQLEARKGELKSFDKLCFYCKSGKRALLAAELIAKGEVVDELMFIDDVLN